MESRKVNYWISYKYFGGIIKIAIIGTGYVGLVTGVCLADFGNDIICVDNNEEKIDILNKGQLPIYEPGLKEIIERNRDYRRIEFTIDIKYAVRIVKWYL